MYVQHATKLYERVAGLRASLQSRLEDPATEAAELQEAVELLRLLGVGSHELCTAFLQHAAAQVRGNLDQSFCRALLNPGFASFGRVGVASGLGSEGDRGFHSGPC